MGQNFWDRIAWFYDFTQRTNRQVNAEAVRRTAALIPEGASVLECAAGTGSFSLAAAKRARSVLCTDAAPSMLEIAAKKARKQGLSNLTFAIRDLTSLPESDGTFDVVLAANVLHLLPDPKPAVRELWRVTAPGGTLILPTYLQGKTGTSYGTLVKIYQGVGFHYEHAFTPETYRELLESLALAPVTLDVISGRMPEGIAVMRKST